MNEIKIIWKALLTLMLSLAINIAQAQTSSDIAFAEFWNASSAEATDASIDTLLQSNLSFNEVYLRLQQGRDYVSAETGTSLHSYLGPAGTEFYYHLVVPSNYDPAKEYQVRFDLHGGVGGRRDNQPGGRNPGQVRLEGAEQIHIMPYAWSAVPWWSDAQVDNLREILDQVKRQYNINENRVVLAGISDGGSGLHYIAMRESTRFASFQSLIGFVMVLASSSIDDGKSFLNNLLNKPFLVINGANDPLYPAARVTPVIEYFQANGADIDYYVMPEGEHNTRWWPEMRDTFEDFVSDHPRVPHPASLTWKATSGLNNRVHWLVIDEIDLEQKAPAPMPELGIDSKRSLFAMDNAAGRVDLERSGNTIYATTEGVASFRLLLSPEVFDLSQEVQVFVNNALVSSGMVQASTETLLRWAAQDNDRKMLYAAELTIAL